jgi:D-sedoheptulose 7-phosphate isomerase
MGRTVTTDTLEAEFARQMTASIEAKQRLLASPEAAVAVARVLIDAYRAGNCLFIFGNGGSAADAQHIAAEFLGRFYIERPSMAAHALTVNTSALTAIGNDYSFDEVFARQLRGLGRRGDVAVGISTSGNALNVARALDAARDLGMVSVALTGSRGGRAREVADYWVGVPSDDTPRIQEAHIAIGHIWSALVEDALYGSGTGDAAGAAEAAPAAEALPSAASASGAPVSSAQR